MNGIDLSIIICSGGLCLWGLIKGLTRMVMTILAIFVGFIFATRSYHVIGGWAGGFVGNRSLAMMIGFIAAFVFVAVVFSIISNIIRKVLDSINLGCLDHVLGAAFGLVGGILFSSIVVIVMALFAPDREEVLKRSYLAPYVIEFSSIVVRLIPADLREEFLEKYYDFRRHTEGDESVAFAPELPRDDGGAGDGHAPDSRPL
jgi:membrane protein required for colicin V production